jgi:hypothetical protein
MNSAGERIQFGDGDYLTRYPAGHHYELRIESPFEKPGWKARSFSTIGQAIFPGTAIEFEGLYYEIILQDFDSGPPSMMSYYLKRWDDTHTIRAQFHYSEEESQKLNQSRRRQTQTNQITVLLQILSPVLGMLPAEDQSRISNHFGIPATQMTSISALSMLLLAGYLMFFSIAHAIGGAPLPGPEWLHGIYPFGFYFLIECLLRMMTSMKLEEPIGSLPVALPLLCIRAIRQSFDAEYKQRQLVAMKSPGQKYQKILAQARDEVLKVTSDDHDLEVISLLPKGHWNARLGIGYNGEWYGLVGSEKIRQGSHTRYRYFLKKAEEGTWFASVREYDPDEVKALLREKRRTDLKTWVDTFAPVWGLLSRNDQVRLEELYDFDALKFTKVTIAILGLFGAINLIICITKIAVHVAGRVDAWIVLPALFLTLESALRWSEVRKGEPAGSALGILIRPFATTLLQGP